MIYNSLAPHRHPELPDGATGRRLAGSGIQRVLVGHRPFGDSPQVLRDVDHDVNYVMCDTCYSNPIELRGPRRSPSVVHGITIEGPVEGPNVLRLKGVLHSGQVYESVIDLHNTADPIGRATDDGWWVKCRDSSPDSFLVTRGVGHSVEVESRRLADLRLCSDVHSSPNSPTA